MLSSRETFPGICADPKISSGCPVACATASDCYIPRLEEDTKKYSIFNRIIRVDTQSQHHTGAVLFVRDLFDPVDACLKHVPTEDRFDTRSFSPLVWQGLPWTMECF